MDKERTVDIRKLFVEYKTYSGMVKVLNGVDIYVNKGEKVRNFLDFMHFMRYNPHKLEHVTSL